MAEADSFTSSRKRWKREIGQVFRYQPKCELAKKFLVRPIRNFFANFLSKFPGSDQWGDSVS